MYKMFDFRTAEPQKIADVIEAASKVVGRTQKVDDPELRDGTAMLSCSVGEYQTVFTLEAESNLSNKAFISLMAQQLQAGVLAYCPHWDEIDIEMNMLGYTNDVQAQVLALPDGTFYTVSNSEDEEPDLSSKKPLPIQSVLTEKGYANTI